LGIDVKTHIAAALLVGTLLASGCAKKPAPETVASQAPGASEYTATQEEGDPTARLQADLVAKAGADRVYFDLDGFELTPAAQQVLARQAQWFQANPNIGVTIEGHCDERGTREYNLALGERRANSVKNFLAGQGVSVSRLSTISYGKERPEALGSDEASYARNRRAVSLVIAPL
jgi:peptidoglycan-associated lipoprotein